MTSFVNDGATVHRVLGVDAYRRGWVGLVLTEVPAMRPLLDGFVAPDIATLVAAASTRGALDVVGIDIPIGLPDRSRREADTAARSQLGRRASSVFTTPTRAALESADFATGNALNRELTGDGMSIQAYGLRAKVLDVDRWCRRAAVRVCEIHPELTFATMSGPGASALESKATYAGMSARLGLLEHNGIELRSDAVGPAGLAGTDDVLDAAAVAWSALRVARGEARCVPREPEVFSDGWPAAIWT